jgi:site-specific DNA-cytosine methylase
METGPKKKKLSANGKRVYHDLQEAGGDCGTEEQFYDFLNAPREQGYKNRRKVYEDLKKSGGDPGTYEQFAQWLGVHPIKPSAPVAAAQKPAAAQTAHPQQTAQAAAPVQRAPAAKPKPRNGQLTAAQRQAYIARAQQMSQQVGASVQRTRNRMGYAMATSGLKTPRVQLGSKASGGAKLGENSRVVATQPKFNPATGKMERVYLTELGNEYTSRAEADMEQNEIDEAVQQQLYPGYNDYNDKQAVAAQAPATAVAAQLWKEAQKAYDAERNANAKEVYGGNPWLRGGREMHVVDGATNSGKNDESRLKHFDLQKMSDNAWARVGKQMTASCYARLRKMYPNALERQVQASAEKEARALVQNAVYKYAVKMNAPKSQLDFFLRKAVDANLLTSVFRGLARYGAGTTGDMAAYEAANEEYGKSHRWTGVFGTATGMAFDPTNWVGVYIGSLGGKAALNIGGRFVLGSAPGVGARLFGSTMAGRLATGAASGMGMMGTYEGVKEAERQWVYGGHVNPETRENEGYSAGAVALSALKGAGLGAMTGMVSPLVGNVADKVVQTTTSATGKVATRLGEVATSAVAEGTIFAMPAVISGQESFVDAWTESMAMIVGFKGQHMVKSAGQVIAGMRPVANPRTMEERNRNRRGFAENLKRTMDAGANKQWNGNQPDVRFTKEELAELKQMGYGNLASLLTPTEKVLPKKKPSQPKHPKNTDGLTVYFDVGSGKKEADPKMKWLQQHPEFDGYATMEKLMQDPNVSQAARANAYYMLTGRQLPMGTITGWNVGKDDKGNIWVKSVTSEGEVVTSRRFTDEASAKREEAKIIRQVELNTVDMGEQYKEMQANAAVVETAIKAVAPNADVNEAMRVYGEVKKGNKDYDSYKDLAKSIDEAIASNPEAVERAKTLLPENIRKDIAEQTGVEVDKALGKPEAERTDAEKQAVQTYLERLYDKSASDDAATPPDAQLQGPEQFAEAYAKHRTHKGSGQVVPATMKAGDRKVYVIDGDVVQYTDKSGIDVAKSDKSIVVCDAETGKYEYTSPDQLMNVGEPADPSTLSEAYMANERAKEAAANGEGTAEGNAAAESNAAANGDVSSDGGKAEVEEPAYTDGSRVEINGHEYDVKSAGEKTVVLVDEHGKELAWTRSALDAKLESGDAEVLEPKAEAAPDVATEGLKAGDVFADSDGNALTVKRVDGDKVVAVGADGKEQTYEDGMFEQMVESGVLKRAQKTEEPSEAKVDLTDNQGNSTPQPDLSSESKGAEQSSGVQAEVPQAEVQENAPMPMRVVGKGKNAAQEEDWLATTPKRGHDYVFKESGLDAEEANAFVENKVAEAEKNLEKVKGKAPKMGTNIAAYKEAKADYEARVAEAQKAVDYWHAVKAERDKVLLEERRARKEKDKALYDDAVAQEEQRKAEMAQKAAEQEALGSNAVAPAIKEKWENAPKVDGGADEITLPNGEVVTGHYVLTESGAASASHQATNGFAETEGYPVDVNGETVNDRDYKRDAEAQQVTRGMAADYDSRALQSPVVVSGDGVVLSGNGRTMAGEIAALNGSDAKYNAYLRGHAGKFGFTTEQVEGFEHPRVVFVPDGEMPYTSETFAKFNQREQKSQSRTEMAVKLGKVVDDALFGRVMDVIGRHESLAEFYADDAATASVVKELADAGVIPQTEMAQLFDGGRLSESGQAMVEGVLVGKVFQGSPDAVRQITEVKSMRKAVMAALPEVVACHRLGGGYDLSKELAAAVDLVYKARKAGFKLGQHVSQHARQGNLFQLDDGATVADYNNAAVMMLADVMNDGRVTQLKKVLSFYNTQAADSAQGIGDMFAGGVKSKGQIINEVNELLNNGQEYDRRTPSVADGQGVGGEGGEQGDVAGPSHQGGAGSERGLSEAFDGLAAQLKTAEGEERKRVLGEMRDGIARFAEENGYPVPEFLLTREDFLAAVPEKDRAKYVEWLDDGAHMPAYYTKGKVYVYVEGCETFDKDVNETLAHEYTHADNAEFPENVNALTYALEDTHEVTRDELREILREMSQGEHYDREAERLEAEDKDVNKMLADEVIAHAVARMVVEGEQVLDGITKNPTLQFIIKRAYKARENERQYNIRARENAERHDNASEGDNRGGSNNGANVEGESANGGVGRPVNGSEGGEVSSERGRSAVSGGKEVAAPSLEGAKVGVTDGEKSSATGDVVPSGKGDTPLSEKIATASAEVNTEPTEAQKEAGNYKKGHVQVGTFDITIEQPQGSVRKGTDADGKQWESKMNNTYGYIRGAVGVDGDHIDVFLSNDIDSWNGRRVFVVDQYNPDGSFDEHKVMLGFNDADEAKSDYLANYENGWENGRRIDVTAVNLEDFEKWIASSKRKTKPFGEYSSVKNGVVPSGKGKTDNLRQQKAVGTSAQPPTREESILRDVVIEHMKGSGLDVIGTEDGQRVLDMVNEDGAKEHRVYHGSGAEFDHFDHSHMGEGEGAQAYGWGTYVTEVRGIGEGYAIRSKNGISMSREEWSLKRSELESNIYRAKEQLPFLKGEYKTEVEAQISEWEEQLKDYEPHNYLYTVEIPDDNGGNYLDWNGPVPAETIDRITEYLREKYGDEVVNGRWLSNPLLSSKGVDVSARNGAAIYRQLERALGSDKKASLALAELGYAGIKYPAEFRSGGRKDGAKNYVIFNENDAEITDHVRFFKTKNGEAYGFTVGGKIYYDPRIANAETPVHEYAHLWASALKANNAKEWKNVVELMKGTNVWEEVKKAYPELETDDEIADEVLATYSGRRGAERLREEMRKAAAEGNGVMGKAEAVSALQRVKRAIDKFWKAVADFLHIHYTSADEVADRVMKDLLDGVDPRKFVKKDNVKEIDGIRYSLKDGSFLRSGSYFSGGGLLEEGLKDYLDPKVAVEFNEKISGVYRDNFGNHIVTADVRDVDPKELVKDIDGPVQYFHASPVCKNFSTAKRDGGEVELDKETARSTAQFIGETRPKVVTIENVKGYKNSDALKIITDELTAQGYDWDMGVYNAADYGGYTNRERLIVRAVRDGKLPPKPEALPEGERKGGWIEAVSDLMEGLPEKKSGVPKWVDERLKGEGIDYRHIDKPLYVFGQGNSRTSIPHAFADELLPTLRTKGGDMIIMPDGRVLKVTPRVLARVTGLADDYEMPATDDLAHTVVGNGIPTQLSEHIIGPLLADVFNGGEPARKDGSAHLGRGNVAGEMGAAEDYTAFASRYGVSEDMVKDYALGMETGNLQKANFALAEIRRTMRVANRGMKLSEFGKLFRPVQKELAERYGDIEVLRQEYIDAEMRERGVMEAARKRAEEEAAKRKARADELRLLPEEELDRRYFEAVERGDDAAAREMLDEAARRKGYGDTESEYQGVGAWVAPSNPGYETDEARRDAVGEDSPNLNVEDMAAGYSNQPEDIFVHPDKYSQGLSTSKESGKAIQTAIDDIRNGKKEVKIKVYRAVPTSVKESKLRNGDWVTPSKEYAEMHGNNRLEGKYRIIEDEVPAGELWWDGNDVNEWGFDDGKGYKYKNVENSRKLNDLVTRDDNGEIIAPSKRFDENVEDVRFREDNVKNPAEMSEEEKSSRGNLLLSVPAVNVESNQIVKTEEMSARRAAEKWWREHIGEPLFYDTEVGQVEINENSIGSSLAHRYGQAKLDAITSLKDGFKNAVYLGTMPDFVRQEGVQNHYFAYPIMYNGKRNYVFCRAMQDKNKNRLYVHEVFVADSIQNEGNTLQTAASQPHGGIALYKAILSDVLSAAKVGNNFETLQLSASEKAKHQAANDLARQMHVEGEVEVVTSTEGLTGRQAKAKGWYDVRTGRVTIVLPNNKNAADVRETVFHEVVAHKGLRNLVGEEHFNTFLDNVYNNAEEGIKQTIDEMAEKKYNGDKRKATEEYMAHLAEDGEYVKPENQGFFAKVRDFLTDLLRKVGIKLGFKLTDNDLRYILWRSWKGLAERDGGSVFEKAEDVKMQHELGQTDEARSASGENGIMFREGSDELKDVVEKKKADVERLHEGELDDLRSGARAIGGRLSELNKAMRLQRAYDMSTVASVTELAKTMLKNGLLSEMSDYDVRRLLSVVNNVHGKGDIRPYVQKVVDMMVGNRLRNVSKAFDKLLAMRGKKVDARGVEVQGELDLAGQRMADVVWKGIGMSDDDVADMCADAQDRMMSANGAEAAAAATDYAGWQIVMRYNETIRDSKSEEVRLREDLKRAKEDYDAGRMTREAYMEFRESTNDAIRENRIERAEAYEELYEQLGGAYGESIKRAADFKAAEKARVLEIQHNANSDMEGRPARSYRKETAVDKVLNSSPVQLLFAPLGTFDQMLRMFGSKNVKGEGYLWNRYMRGWLTATENEYTGYRDATAELDAKAAEVLGKGKTWADLFALERKLPKATVRVWDDGEMRGLELPQGNLLYIYMVNKMADGRMKLRKMGVTEDDVAAIEDFIDPRLKEIGDWLQEVYLVEKRGKYNEVYERMFGAAMASIDNYFPLKILKDARAENVDVGVEKRESEMASTITGSFIKRKRNALPLDLLNSDAFSVVLDHLQEMEHISAYAEWNRDLNTLLSYKHFRNQVKNMRSAYGSGERLWKAFNKVACIAAGTYDPPKALADKLAVNIAKGVTAAKILYRMFTAFKQLTSFPAYLSDSNPVYLLKGVANPYGSWKWCMENLPLFEKRWKSRMAGDPRLLKNEMDWSLWRDNVVQMAARWGMTPNAFVDALTVCIGARAMYETRRRKYIRYGYGLEEAERRAKQDASILYNQTQQSSEGAFLSALQVDRSWYSVMFTVFRNSSMSYTRQLYAALRNTGRRIAGGAEFKGISEAFMAKQMERDGIDPDRASKNAKAEYRKSWINDLVRAGVFGYVLQLLWNYSPYAIYMMFGDDEKKFEEIKHDVKTHTAWGFLEGLTGGDVWSAGLQSLWNHYVNGEDFNANSVNKDMPLTSDLLNVVKKVGSDNYGAVNDVLNLLVQAGFGVNPQTLTDAAVAIYDYCGSDVETTKECALLVMRVMNCPQSQMDNIYFDEIDATGEEAKAMSVEEIAERYARYKALRSAPLRALSSDALKAAEKKPRERVMTEAKEQLDGRLMTEEAQRYLDEYEATKKKVTETRALADTDPKAFMQQMPALARSGEFRRYRRVGLYKSEVNKLTKKLLRTSDPAERRALFGKMLDARDKMLKQVREME